MENLFEDKADPQGTATQVDNKIKVGNDEYAPEDLEKLVGLGKIGQEAESRFNTSIDKIWPNYTRTSQENETLKKDLEALKAQAEKPPTNDLGAMDETTKEIARRQLKELAGDMFLTKEDIAAAVTPTVDSRLQGYRLLDEIANLQAETKTDGRPVPDTEALLAYMDETGLKTVDLAYKNFYEKPLDAWKEAQLSTIKKQGLDTQESPSADKSPETKMITKDNLNAAVHGYFEAVKGGEAA